MTDEEIVNLFWERDEGAIGFVQEKYKKLCMHLAKNITHNVQDAEECVNDSYFSLWNAIPPNRPIPLLPYLCRIVRNHALKCYDYNHAKKRNVDLEEVFWEFNEIIGTDKEPTAKESVEGTIQYRELVQEINQYLGMVKAQKRQIFLARYFFAATVKEIAEAYEMSEVTVKVTLFRMRNALQTRLQKEGYV